jgi:hypothetical protein
MMMRKAVLSVVILVATLSACLAQTGFQWPEAGSQQKPWTRWWWPGNEVDSPGVAWNLREFHQGGIGGVEVTPIYGVQGLDSEAIGFLTPRWMDMLHYTIQEADSLHMGVDMVTGTGWPFGGPQISLKDAASRVIFRTFSVKGGSRLTEPVAVTDRRQKDVAKLQLVMAYSGDGKKEDLTAKVDATGGLQWTAPKGDWKIIAVFDGKTLQKVKRAAPGGEGWVMDPFSRTALSHYLEPFTKAFNRSKCPVPHSFFDDSYEVFGADWTADFFKEFEARRGYRLQDYLPFLLGEGNADTVCRVVSDYRTTLADMLLDNFAKNWTAWAHRLGSTTRFQAHGSPGNLLDLYAAADIPEIESYGSSHFDISGLPEDSLGDRPGKLDPLLLKFSSSAAHVAGRPLSSSESFTWIGEHFRVSLSECKPVLDELFLSGTNHVYFQGSPYSPQNAPWPGWQFYASINVTPFNTFWHDLPAFDAYITRAQSFLQQGTPDNDVLLYWPVQDVWASHSRQLLYQLTVGAATEWLTPTPFHETARQLMDDGYGLDYSSDRQLQASTVKNGMVQTSGGTTYRALVIPPCTYMPLATLRQIARLARAGATVIFRGRMPGAVPGLHDWRTRQTAFDSLKAALSSGQPFTNVNRKEFGSGVVLSGDNTGLLMRMAGIRPSGFPQSGLQFIRRKDDDGYTFFVVNMGASPVDGWIPLAKDLSSAVLYDPYNGNMGKAAIRKETARGRRSMVSPPTEIYLQVKPGQSLIIRGYPHKDIPGPAWTYTKRAGQPSLLEGPWKVTFGQGAPRIAGTFTMNQLKSWTTLSDSAKVFAGTASYRMTFDLPKEKASDWLLGLGEVDFSARVKVNGHDAGVLWGVPFDIRIGKYLKPGRNVLEVDVTNIGANRIASYDRKGVYWKKFKDINVVNMAYKPFDASSWKPVPSGLLGPVTLMPLESLNP